MIAHSRMPADALMSRLPLSAALIVGDVAVVVQQVPSPGRARGGGGPLRQSARSVCQPPVGGGA